MTHNRADTTIQPPASARAAPPRLAFNHMGLYVFDLAVMEDFYTRVLGFTVSDRGAVRGRDVVFLSADAKEHHQIVLATGRTAPPAAELLNQISFRMDGLAALRALHGIVTAETGVSDIAPVNHVVTWSVYFRDPEGNRIEAFADSPWYDTQPLMEPLDFSLSDEEIVSWTYTLHKDNPGFAPIEEWQRAFGAKLAGSPDAEPGAEPDAE